MHVALRTGALRFSPHLYNRPEDIDLIALNEALDALAAFDKRKSRVVELRFFGGMGVEEIAEVLGVSTATVKRDWSFARAWLYDEMTRS